MQETIFSGYCSILLLLVLLRSIFNEKKENIYWFCVYFLFLLHLGVRLNARTYAISI